MRTDVANAERSVCGELLRDFQAPRFDRRCLKVRLDATRDHLRARIRGVWRDARERNVLGCKDRVERTVLIQAVTQVVEQSVIQTKARSNNSLLGSERRPSGPDAWRREKLRIVHSKGRAADNGLGFDYTLRIEGII